jgi:hypothetical protein
MELMFDSSQVVEQDNSFAPIPAGAYPVICDASEFRNTKAGDGRYLHLELSIVDGPSKGRKIFDNLNLENKNPTAVDIAQRQLAGLVRACGKVKISDSAELHNIPVSATLAVRKGTNGYEDSNDVKSYGPLHDDQANIRAIASASGTPKDNIPF